MKKTTCLAALFAAITLCACNVNVNINLKSSEQESTAKKDTIILYTNDVHCADDGDIGYAGLASYKEKMEETGADVLLVDDGDEIQGAAIGSMTKGDAIIPMMNKVGYDIAIPGNHEFDYGVEKYLELTKEMDFPVICCNFYDLRTGKRVFEPYVIKELGGRKIGFVGTTTPTTLTESVPKYFQDENGEFIYGFCEDEGGKKFYETIQDSVDSTKADGAEIIVLIAHLGINEMDSPYMSTDVIANTSGIDVVLDGHSHSTVEMEKVKNKDGQDVILSQTGCKMEAIGKLTIDADGNMKTELISDYKTKDDDVEAVVKSENSTVSKKLSVVIGKTDYDLRALEDDGETWLDRSNETNLGDFIADSYRYVTKADIGIINGGGVRANINKGDITYGDLLNVTPFSNEVGVRKVTGQEIADALEFSVSFYPDKFGGFLQVSGLTFDVDYSVKSQVKLDDDEAFAGFSGDERRVSNIKVGDEPLDPEKEYNVASISYILFDGGNGYNMFTGDRVNLGVYMEDVDAAIEYLKSLGGVIPEEYSDPSGQGRIHVKEEK